MAQQNDSSLPLSELVLLVAAILFTAAGGFVLTYDLLGLTRQPTPELVEHLRATSAVLWVLWGMRRSRTVLQRRLERMERKIGQRWEEGYAAGYVDGAAARTPATERPGGTVYSMPSGMGRR